MKRKILTTLLSTPIIASCLLAIASCSTTTSNTLRAPVEHEPVKTNEDAIAKHTITFKTTETDVIIEGKTEVEVEDGEYFACVITPKAYKKQYPVAYWADEKNNKMEPNTIIKSNLVLHPCFNPVQIQNCIGLTAIEDSTVSINHYGNNNPDIQYSLDGRTWTKYNLSYVTLLSGQSVYFKGNNPNGFSTSEGDYTSFSIGGAVSLAGNVMTLIDNGLGTRDDIPCDYCFYRLFEGCSGIVSISSKLLPAQKLKTFSYAYMFDNCANLTDFPKSLLEAKVLCQSKEYSGAMCYAGMFSNCTGLKNIPAGLIEATNFGLYSCYAMFENCTGLTKLDSGVLPATLNNLTDSYCYCEMFKDCINITSIANDLLGSETLAEGCYYGMFSGCTGLTDVHELVLPAKELEDYCYDQMFYSCSNLTHAPQMQATKLATGCYTSMYYNCTKLTAVVPFPNNVNVTLAPLACQYMFGNCVGLNAVPAMPQIDTEQAVPIQCFSYMFTNCSNLQTLPTNYLNYLKVDPYCYEFMFYNCSGLTSTMTTLPAETLTEGCYVGMFQNCSSIVIAPRLPAEKASKMCYASMFYGCTKLKYISIGLTTFGETLEEANDASDCLSLMFYRCSTLKINSTTATEYVIQIPDYKWTEAEGGKSSSWFCYGMFTDISESSEIEKYTPEYNTNWYCQN